MNRKQSVALASLGGILLVAAGVAWRQLPALGAGGLLHPARRGVVQPPPQNCRDVTFQGVDVSLHGWQCHAPGMRRGTLIYLHGTADNRTSGRGVIERFGKRGFDVVAYDSRAHGESEGEACTYGFLEKQDLGRVLDGVARGPVVLVGTSLGAAVALQLAAVDARVSAVVAAETFSDLRTVATERSPFFFTPGVVARAFRLAEAQGRFQVDAVSPVVAATAITVPVLLVHGQADSDTPPDHSRRVFAALKGPKRLIVVPGAAHNGSLRAEVWDEIERWLDDVPGVSLRPQPSQPGERAVREIEPYPGSIEFCSQHVTGAPAPDGRPGAHIVWTGSYSTDPPETVVSHYTNTLGARNHRREGSEDTWRFPLAEPERMVSVSAAPGPPPMAACPRLPPSARTVVIVSAIARPD